MILCFLVSICFIVVCILCYSKYGKSYKQIENNNEHIIANLYKSQNEFYIKGQDYERASIAKDLHDSTSGTLYGIKLQLHFLKNNTNDSIENIEKIEKYIDILSQEVKNITKKISPLNLKNFGLKSSINECIVDFEIHELTFEVNCSIGDKRFNEDLESNIYRIFQECVNNVIKHAQANHVKVSLFILEKKLVLIIEDNGKGIMVLPSHSGNGLSNILFRVQHMKGTIDIISKSNIGTKTTINIPL